MVKLWIHERGGTAPYLVTEMSLRDCAARFDLEDAAFLAPLGDGPPTNAAPGPLAADLDPKLVVFEVLSDEASGPLKPGYYASRMTADTVLELIGEE